MRILELAILSLGCFILHPTLSNCTQCAAYKFKGGCDGLRTTHEVVFEDVVNGNVDGLCCDNSTHVKLEQRKKSKCRVTKCVSGKMKKVCSSLGDRFIGKEKLEYEDILTEQCTNHGKDGNIGLCCTETSTEAMLSAAHGAEPNEFPHQVRLNPIGCGGTIYNEEFIITAAHCVVNKGLVIDKDPVRVVVGSNIGIMEPTNEQFSYPIDEIIVHKEYSLLEGNPELAKGEYGKVYNDIALLRLSKKLNLKAPSGKVKALKIAPRNFNATEYALKAVLAGWGTADTWDQSPHLQKAELHLRSDESCYGEGAKLAFLRDYKKMFICIGGIIDGKFYGSAGKGDSGGPLICRSPSGHAVLCGVTSFAAGNQKLCVEHRDEEHCFPNNYAEVSHFRDWIHENTGTTKQAESTLYQPYLYGKNVDSDEYSHQVHITSKTGKKCGGTLIAADVVVTAAQCVASPGRTPDPSKLTVGFKQTDLNSQPEDTFEVESVKVLKGFKRTGKEGDGIGPDGRILYRDNFYQSDLAVLRLKHSVKGVSFPRLPVPEDKYTKGVEVAFPLDTTYGGNLRSRDFKILDMKDCQTRMTRMGRQHGVSPKVNENTLCGVEKYSGSSNCDRELGGGLICKGHNDDDVLCGVQIYRMCMLSLPNTFIDMSRPTNLNFVTDNM